MENRERCSIFSTQQISNQEHDLLVRSRAPACYRPLILRNADYSIPSDSHAHTPESFPFMCQIPSNTVPNRVRCPLISTNTRPNDATSAASTPSCCPGIGTRLHRSYACKCIFEPW